MEHVRWLQRAGAQLPADIQKQMFDMLSKNLVFL